MHAADHTIGVIGVLPFEINVHTARLTPVRAKLKRRCCGWPAHGLDGEMDTESRSEEERNTTAPRHVLCNVLLQRVSAVVMALGVGLGAYGAHGLEADTKGIANWKTAVLYHLIHAIALYVLASRPLDKSGTKRCCPNGPWWCLLAGILLFCGMLYTIVLTGVTWLGAIVPIGGLAMIVGWLWLAISPRNR